MDKIDERHYRYSADVFDTTELIPWIRSFTGFICAIDIADKKVEQTLLSDLEQMYALYDVPAKA